MGILIHKPCGVGFCGDDDHENPGVLSGAQIKCTGHLCLIL